MSVMLEEKTKKCRKSGGGEQGNFGSDKTAPYVDMTVAIHHEKQWAGRSTSWNQDFWEKYQ